MAGVVVENLLPASVSVHTTSQIVGTKVTQAYAWRLHLEQDDRGKDQRDGSQHLVGGMPNNGHKVLMPPSGSTTPW